MFNPVRNFRRHAAACAMPAVAVMLASQLGGPSFAADAIVTEPSSTATSAALSSLPKAQAKSGLQAIRPAPRLVLKGAKQGGPYPADPALQNRHFALPSSGPKAGYNGIGFSGYLPPDPDIAVGLTYIVQAVNSQVAVINKSTGAMLAGYPKSLSSLWQPLGGGCATNNGGDPSVQYDNQAKRWVITQLGSLSSPYSECIAVSQTDDPTGTYNLFSYSFGSSLNDYPKFSVWPSTNADYSGSAYLATYNMFYGSSGTQLCAYERQAMLSLDPNISSKARQVCQSVPEYSYLPSDLDGATPPPTVSGSTPAYFVTDDNSSRVQVRTATFSFGTTASLTVSPISNLSVLSFSPACGGGTCVPQSGTSRTLDSLADRPMYRLAYRNFGTSESMVFSHSVASGSGSGIRWYELCRSNAANNFAICQQSTHAPDGNYRWMGSMAINGDGVIALGYSASGSSQYPSLRYTTGTVGGSGVMAAEQVLQTGSGSQTGYSRWGDYSSMRVDPSDDKTFWYTGEYYKTTSSYTWSTYVGSIATAPDYSLSATPSLVSFPENLAASQDITINAGALGGYSGSVSLSLGTCSSLFSWAQPSPSSFTVPGSAIVTLGTLAAPATSAQTCDVTATDAKNIIHTVTLSAQRLADFALSLVSPANPSVVISSASVTRGGSVSITVKVPWQATTSSVRLSASGLPPGASASFTPNPVATGASSTSALKITTKKTMKIGVFNLTISGNNGNFTHSAPLALTVN